jgi:hypothetical protein|eukprot:COSAG01_NODE_2927_length_6839_cov_3.199407_4_plen_75_part_00
MYQPYMYTTIAHRQTGIDTDRFVTLVITSVTGRRFVTLLISSVTNRRRDIRLTCWAHAGHAAGVSAFATRLHRR